MEVLYTHNDPLNNTVEAITKRKIFSNEISFVNGAVL